MPAKNTLAVLFLGDIIGSPGLRAVLTSVSKLRSKYSADVVIANGENISNGFGITPEIATNLLNNDIDVITTGNHVWHDKSINEWLDHEPRLLRPCNYARSLPGSGMYNFTARNTEIAVINAQGRQYMSTIDCPFKRTKELCKELKSSCKTIIVDFHAESTLEKECYAYYMANDVSAILGTHSHVQTSDERIIQEHTAYITDVGACSVQESVIGFNPDASLARFLKQQIGNTQIDDTQTATIHGVVLTIDSESGACKHIERVEKPSLV